MLNYHYRLIRKKKEKEINDNVIFPLWLLVFFLFHQYIFDDDND